MIGGQEMQYLLCALLGYCFGNINPAYIISKAKGFDIREFGTGNAGASNMAIIVGKKAGAFTALFDIAKAALAAVIAGALFPQIAAAKIIGGCACILGHIYPVLMKFHGGKGLACIAGALLGYNPKLFLILLVIEVAAALLLDYICVISITGPVIFTLIYFFTTKEPVGTVCLAIVAVIMVSKHIVNLKKIKEGTETHISFLWKKKDKEKKDEE